MRPGAGFGHTPHGKAGLLRDRPTLVAVSAGGSIFESGARQPDAFRPCLVAAMKTIGITEVRFVAFDRATAAADPLASAAQFAPGRIARNSPAAPT